MTFGLKKQGLILGLAAILAACGSDDGGGPASDKLAEYEITQDIGGDIDVYRSVFTWDNDKATAITQYVNGEIKGRGEVAYQGNHLGTIALFDEDGDRALHTMTYEGSKISRHIYELPTWSSFMSDYIYNDDGTMQEILHRNTDIPGETTDTSYDRYTYLDGMLSTTTHIAGETTNTTDYRYDPDNRLERMSHYSEGQHINTYEYQYDAEGRLFEVLDKDQNRYSVTYDEEGRIARIQYIFPGGSRSVRYTYAPGSVKGFTFAPHLPGMVDLRGDAVYEPTFEHLSLPVAGDYPTARSTGGGGGGDGGNANTCEQRWPSNGDACNTCANNSCCSQQVACADSADCLDWVSCAENCEDQMCADACSDQYPTGAQQYGSMYSCMQSSCASDCGL